MRAPCVSGMDCDESDMAKYERTLIIVHVVANCRKVTLLIPSVLYDIRTFVS